MFARGSRAQTNGEELNRILVAVGPAADSAELQQYSDSVEIAEWVPQADVLPLADLVVHHGGAGTTISSAAAGVAQIVIPQGADQFRNAEAVDERGIGRQVLPDEVAGMPSPATIAQSLGDRRFRAA